MPQVFGRYSNFWSRSTVAGLVLGFCLFVAAAYRIQDSAYYSRQYEVRHQPVPFSHAHHVGGLGIDCRYCHTSVETAAFAGLPPTKTCMNCHVEIWNRSPMLEPVRASFRTGRPLRWMRVNYLPDFVYFRHDIHIAKGVGCQTCHGHVDRMALMEQAKPLTMRWCLDCHRAPFNYLRPRAQVFNTEYIRPPNQVRLGKQLMKRYHVLDPRTLTSCSTCHR